ncbi:hypothetical protein MmiHf6_01000 [Methanimicrococcus hongohii]|uniref:Uncharacterized protein n=1 Tax=Methanimicrococcus hongohii TaxID=3028295 RepID=A0AA96V014_9EURY|nr:hypothetical protein MmiHf6_01000 [Methanimicrococcus sp. Hf6]
MGFVCAAGQVYTVAAAARASCTKSLKNNQKGGGISKKMKSENALKIDRNKNKRTEKRKNYSAFLM